MNAAGTTIETRATAIGMTSDYRTLMNDTAPVDDPDNFKEFLIFRVDVLDEEYGIHRELAGESALENGAASYADMMAESESEPGIQYEVRAAGTGRLLHASEISGTSETVNTINHQNVRGPREEEAWVPCIGTATEQLQFAPMS